MHSASPCGCFFQPLERFFFFWWVRSASISAGRPLPPSMLSARSASWPICLPASLWETPQAAIQPKPAVARPSSTTMPTARLGGVHGVVRARHQDAAALSSRHHNVAQSSRRNNAQPDEAAQCPQPEKHRKDDAHSQQSHARAVTLLGAFPQLFHRGQLRARQRNFWPTGASRRTALPVPPLAWACRWLW